MNYQYINFFLSYNRKIKQAIKYWRVLNIRQGFIAFLITVIPTAAKKYQKVIVTFD